jgi:RNA polymerase sigma-70 factor (ECF subfamily)
MSPTSGGKEETLSMTITDDELLSLCQGGDRDAFQVLVEKYQHKVYTIAYRFMGNEADASDLAQEAFIKVYRKLPTFRGESSFLTWLYHITANTCRDELRKRQNKGTVSLDSFSTQQGDRTSRVEGVRTIVAGPEEVLEAREAQRNLQIVLNQLPVEQKLILIMREIQGFSYEEIAHQLECSLGTVKSRLSRARGALRELVVANGELFGLPSQVNAMKGRG